VDLYAAITGKCGRVPQASCFNLTGCFCPHCPGRPAGQGYDWLATSTIIPALTKLLPPPATTAAPFETKAARTGRPVLVALKSDEDVEAFGAKADGKTFSGSAFNHAIQACAAAGGGTVRAHGSGVYITGNIQVWQINAFLEPFFMTNKTIILPRQAQDEHRSS
jgi:hypothetical protein